MKKPQGSTAYAKAGVDLNAGEVFSAFAGKIARASYGNSPYVEVYDGSKSHFRGPKGWRYVGLPEDYFEVAAPDGIGTATILVSAAGAHRTSSSRLLAMTAMDNTRYGGLSLVFTNILETKALGKPHSKVFEAYKSMMTGLGDYAKKQNYVLMGGETAEMGVCVGSELLIGSITTTAPIYNWSGVMLGVNHPDKVINGNSLRPGQRIIALRDELRSNGGSLMRRFFRQRFGDTWWEDPDCWGVLDKVASPAELYDKFLACMNGWYSPGFKKIINMHTIAHNTGGGIESKFARDILFPSGLSAVLDVLPAPPSFMYDCIRELKIGDEEAYRVLGCGIGALIVVDESDVEKFLDEAHRAGIRAGVAGHIAKRRYRVPRVEVTSGFTGNTFTIS